jgi:hypothetical protein
MWAHIVNVLLYALCCFLAFLFFKEILPEKDLKIAIIGAVLFTIHPIHNEVVNNIKSRDEIIMLCFGLGAILFAFYALKKQTLWGLGAFFLLGLIAAYAKDNGAILIAFTPLLLSFTAYRKRPASYLIILLASIVLLLRIPYYDLSSRVYMAMAYILLMIISLNLRDWISKRSIKPSIREFKSQVVEIGGTGKIQMLNAGLLLVLSIVAAIFDMRIIMAALMFLSIPFLWTSEERLKVLPGVLLATFGLVIQNEVILSLGGTAGFLYLWKNQGKARWIGLIPIVLGLASLNPKYAGLMLAVGLFSFAGIFLKKERFLPFVFILPCLVLLAIFPQQTAGAVSAAMISSGVWWLLDSRFPKALPAMPLLFVLASSWVCISTYQPADANVTQRIAIWNNKKVMSEENPGVDNRQIESLPTEIGKQEISRSIKLAENPLDYLPSRSEKLGLAAASWGFYLKQSFFPLKHSFYYGYNTIHAKPLSHTMNLLWLLSLLGFIGLGLFGYFRGALFGVGLLFFVWNLFPFLNLAFPAPGIVAERFAFASSLGLCLSIAIGLNYLLQKFNSKDKALVVLILGLTIACTLHAWNRNPDWKNMLTLVSADIESVPESAKMNQLYATNTMANALGDGIAPPSLEGIDKGIFHFQECVRIDPGFPFAWFDLGNAYLVRNRLVNRQNPGRSPDIDSAKLAFRKSVIVDSFYVEAPFFLASLHQESGQVDSAEKYYLEAIKRDSSYIFSYTNLSMLYFNIEDFEKSLRVNYQAKKINPEVYPPIINLGKTYMHIGEIDSAFKYLNLAYAMNPEEPGLGAALNDLLLQIKSDTTHND